MFQLINSILHEFRACFKREKTWQWFVIIVTGFMTRYNHRGVTSIISAMKLKPELYHTLLHFFRSDAYEVKALSAKWVEIAVKNGKMQRSSCKRLIVLGDHSKVSKEGLRMPSIQILHQDSQNSGKADYIEGHNFGQVSAIITNGEV